MTVRELIDGLKMCDPDRLVILAKDAEGNGFSPLSNVEACNYEAENTWSGEIHEGDDDAGVHAIVLWPTN